ncbi:putative cell differentiation protein RCD1 -like protein [Capsicum annuum]|nr:putative cell differentiation protein RCD1 -like protein [Capsicum annuum]KAF3649300.1 putative cell differentiation protein RCD1 -like protein [Capsicum annuum]
MANKDIEFIVTDQIGCLGNENVGANKESRKLRQQMIEIHRAWANRLSPPPFPADNLEYLSNPTLNISGDQCYTFEPTFKLTGLYGDAQPPEFPPNTEKPVMTEKQEKMTKKLRSLELTMKNLQGLGGYKSVSYKDLFMFPDVHLPLGFKMPKFEKYNGQGNPVAHLRRYYNQLRSAGGKEELLMAYFGESPSDLASEWFVDQDIDKWNSWNDLANEFVQQFQ